VGVLLALALPATAIADPPKATTGRATDITQSTATLHGKANPNGNSSSAYFQYGTLRTYGATTPAQSVGSGKTGVAVGAPIGGLSPNTRYHFRLVVQWGNRVVFGDDHTFRTAKQPLGLTLVATPDRVRSGDSSTLSGNLSGSDAQGKEVQLQVNRFPFSGFENFGNAQVVDSSGNFSFPILQVFTNTQFRVYVVDQPEIGSPVVGVVVPVRVHLRVARRVHRGKIRFRGRITPVSDNSAVEIQRRFHGVWVTVARTHTTDNAAGSSYFRKKVRVRRSGRYRALVTPGGEYVSDVSRVHRVRVVHRRR
jgi:hypothetical protein